MHQLLELQSVGCVQKTRDSRSILEIREPVQGLTLSQKFCEKLD